MSTNEAESDEPTAAAPSAPGEAEGPTATSAPAAAAPTTPAAYPPHAAPAPYPYAGYDPTFGPVARPPRTRWIAPQRKAAVTAIALVAAVLLLGIGALFGAAVTRHHDRLDGFQRGGVVSRQHPGPDQRNVAPPGQRPAGPRAPAPARS